MDTMDPELWGKLPEDVVPHILARLPWWSIMKCRIVSKPWQSLLSDPIFLRDAGSSRGARDPPCVIVSNEYYVYAILNSGTQKHHLIPHENMFPQEHPQKDRFHLRTSAGGVFLMQVSYSCRDRFLCNPLNGTQKLLPRIPPHPVDPDNSPWEKLHLPKTYMMVDDTGALRIICTQVRETPDQFPDTVLWNVHLYDFVADKWDLYATDLPSRRLLFVFSATFVGGHIYIMAKCCATNFTEPYRGKHLLFRVHSRHMVDIPIHFTDGILEVRVFQHRGALMIVHGTPQPDTVKPFSVKIWRYDDILESWELVVSMPNSFVDSFYAEMSREGVFYFNIEGDTCCFSNRLYSECIVLYHFARNEWWQVSASEVVNGCFRKERLGTHMKTYMWQPRLDVVLSNQTTADCLNRTA